ncbi:MAG: CYTH domain-containing protein, partial [Micromonosporaceae bacterium]|nr:CYTH domain-containing protein [Micromonosporaceae bacterium]
MPTRAVSGTTLPLVLEEERKYEVGPLFTLPDLRAAVPKGGGIVDQPAVTLRATYYDTADLRLARAGASLRHRRGKPGDPWTLKLPYGEPHVRREITARGPASRIPETLSRLALAYTRGASLSPVTTLQTIRRARQVRDAAGQILAEVADDTVTVLDGRRVISRFREVEVERRAGDRTLLARLERLLITAGAGASSRPKSVRALGPLAAEPADLPPPEDLRPDPLMADVLINELRRQVGQVVSYDPVVRLHPDELDGVDHLRGANGRLHADLRAFAPLFATPPLASGGGRRPARRSASLLGAARVAAPAPPPFGDPLESLRRLSRTLLAVRTPQVLRQRLAEAGDGKISAAEALDPEVLTRLDAVLGAIAGHGAADLSALLVSDPHIALLDGLVTVARAPRLRHLAHEPATEILPALAATFWERLSHAVDQLRPESEPGQWRSARTAARRLSRLCQLAEPALGERAR